jgi:hypothetical protein
MKRTFERGRVCVCMMTDGCAPTTHTHYLSQPDSHPDINTHLPCLPSHMPSSDTIDTLSAYTLRATPASYTHNTLWAFLITCSHPSHPHLHTHGANTLAPSTTPPNLSIPDVQFPVLLSISHQEPVSGQACNPIDPHLFFLSFSR